MIELKSLKEALRVVGCGSLWIAYGVPNDMEIEEVNHLIS